MSKFILIVMSIAAGIIYTLQRMHVHIPGWINNYVNDFLCLPILLGFLTFLFRRLKKDENFRFSILFILCITCYYSFYFEYYLPQNSIRYTSDIIDVILYFSGGILFYFLNNSTLIMKLFNFSSTKKK